MYMYRYVPKLPIPYRHTKRSHHQSEPILFPMNLNLNLKPEPIQREGERSQYQPKPILFPINLNPQP